MTVEVKAFAKRKEISGQLVSFSCRYRFGDDHGIILSVCLLQRDLGMEYLLSLQLVQN